MSSHSPNEQVQPTPFELTPPPASSEEPTRAAAPQGPRPWVLPALGGLALLALLVVFGLPAMVGQPTGETGEGSREASTASAATDTGQTAGNPTTASKPAKADVTPWSDAQAAKLRKEAQDVLAELVELQFTLEERGIKEWAPERFAAVATTAAAGDELFRSRDYQQAQARYQEALTDLQALQEGIPAEFARQLELANTALETGDQDATFTALDQAELIEPGNTEVAALRQRAQAIPQMQALLEQAAAAEAQDDLAGAEQSLKEATAVDPQHQRAQAELQRVTTTYREQQFNEAMSSGYSALDQNRFEQARKAFRQAAQLQSGSSEAASALREVDTAATDYRLASLKTTGYKQEQKEQWQQAVDAYQEALKLDSNVLYAREGLARSGGRARLDKQFRTAIDEPQRLSDPAVAKVTEQLLQQARKIPSPGPVLSGQIDRLQQLLVRASTPIAVTLRSDEATEVTVYKVARLGRFNQRELSLRPGSYTAVGSRNGYRDVRLDFTIDHDQPPSPITIACTEPI